MAGTGGGALFATHFCLWLHESIMLRYKHSGSNKRVRGKAAYRCAFAVIAEPAHHKCIVHETLSL